MLTDDERARIRIEEEFRHEVREELARGADRWRNKTWRFLNSAFGLWLLTSVAVSGVGFLFTSWRDGRARAEERTARLARIGFEIQYRLSQTIDSLFVLSKAVDSTFRLKPGVRTVVVDSLIMRMASAPDDRRVDPLRAMYAEFSGRTMPTLLAELGLLYSDPRDRATVTSGINMLGQRSALAPFYDQPALVAGDLLRFLRPPLLQPAFAYLDCPPERPFC